MTVEPGSEEERLLLGRWIKKGQGLIVGGSALGDAYFDAKLNREDEAARKSEEYVKYDREMADKLPHLKGRFRWDLEKYFRDRYGPYLPKD